MVRKILTFVSCFFFTFSVYAGEPDCGYADNGVLEDVYRAAERVDYYNDAVSDIDYACSISEDLKLWDRELDDAVSRSREYKRARKQVISDFDDALRRLYGPLLSFYGYIYGERNNESRAVRAARIRAAQKKVNSARAYLIESADEMEEFMERY